MENATIIPARGWRERHQATLTESRHNLRIFLHDKLAVIGCAIIVAFFAIAVFAPWLAPFPEQGKGASNVSERLQAPSAKHLLGTDEEGRDMLSRVMFGARLPLAISALVAMGILAIGVPLGGIAGYYGGMVDEVLMRITDVFLSFPSLILAMLLVAFVGPSLRNIGLALIITWWPWYTRLVRSMAISLRERPYALAAKTMGVSNIRIILRHILPNSMGPVIVQITLDVGSVILAIAGLSFIGLGAQQPTPEWGLMVSSGREYIFEAWWYSTFPGLAILLLVLAYNLVGDGLRDVLDPRTKR
jgi:peptide/nickel transport system permease protein